jgi:hypothetical protein
VDTIYLRNFRIDLVRDPKEDGGKMPHSQTTKWGKATPSASHFNHLDL